MAKKLTTVAQYAFFLGLGVFLIWWSLKGLTAEDRLQITHALEKGRYWLILPGIAVNLLSHWLRAVRWRLIIQTLGYSPTKLNTFFAVMIGYLANQAVPRLGEVLRCSTLTRYEKIPLDKLVGTVILERLVDTICLLAVFLLALAIQPYLYQNILATFFPAKEGGNGGNLLFYIGLALLAVMVLTFLWMWFTKKRFSDLVALFRKISLHIWQGFISIRALKKRWAFVFLSIAIWALYAFSVYIGFLMLEETMQYGLKEALTVLCAGTLAMAATPGGIGAYAFLVQKTMTIYQLSSGLGLALGWLLWLLQVVVVLVVGGLSLIGLPVYNKNRQKSS
ncbi:lysylphosphatidylglycerol synthase transmembrane domain-containing protein [Niabella hibiscisoli]|uniref:lysylphosphatidylglycerol synthase transmembrane domain-containing protein n=1 Tax=Niabella hibiscisoli TaxID=1825928 RepID=UPI001F0DA419|nr:lysylphosphatidylglycerol synthase transmembrane domain-containing protein [Niabella hibiscisoli]MCH5719152.1 flippase-like domain-containing protein [Niabella hibiscisoli]